MAISANQIVQVLPRILTGTGKDLQFNGLVLDKSNLIPVDEVLSFGDNVFRKTELLIKRCGIVERRALA